jgi:branched-chain amino acid transport system permease protein
VTAMWLFTQTLVNGLLSGGLYALLALGLTLAFGVMRVINFAHGEFMMLGLYVTSCLFALAGVDPYLSLLVSAPALFGVGVLLQKGLINRVLKESELNQILLMIGISLVLANGARFVFGAEHRVLTTSYSGAVLGLGGVSVSVQSLLSLGMVVLIMLGLWLWLTRTDFGRALRATAQDRVLAQMVGINVTRVYAITFGLGAALAGAAGSLLVPAYYVFPSVGEGLLLKGFVVVVLGGMGSMAGAIVGAMLLGVAESLAAVYLGAGYKDLVGLLLFLGILLLKPAGLFGTSRT